MFRHANKVSTPPSKLNEFYICIEGGVILYRINLFNKVVRIKSMAPKKVAMATEIPITTRVFLIVSCLEGQLTFFISNLTSFKKVVILVKIFI